MPPRKSKSDPNYEAWLDELITLEEASTIRKVSARTIRRMGEAGKLKLVRPSPGRVMISRREAMRDI